MLRLSFQGWPWTAARRGRATRSVLVAVRIDHVVHADDFPVLRADEAGIDTHLAFSLKEAAYKAWSATGGRLLDHHEVRLTIGVGHFDAVVVDDGVTFAGRFAIVGERTVALVVVPS